MLKYGWAENGHVRSSSFYALLTSMVVPFFT